MCDISYGSIEGNVLIALYHKSARIHKFVSGIPESFNCAEFGLLFGRRSFLGLGDPVSPTVNRCWVLTANSESLIAKLSKSPKTE